MYLLVFDRSAVTHRLDMSIESYYVLRWGSTDSVKTKILISLNILDKIDCPFMLCFWSGFLGVRSRSV